MADLINRQSAIDIEQNATVDTNPSHFEAHQKFTQFMDDAEISSFGMWQWSNGFNTALTAVSIDLKKLPSAQPVAKDIDVPNTDTISRQDAIRIVDGIDTWQAGWRGDAIESIKALPSAQPEHTNSCYTNSWCIDCKEYDTENKCCPRYNRVIKQTLDDAYRHGETEAEARFYAEIVRCKDCNHWSRESICDGFCSEDCMRHDEDFYCGYAERKTNERFDINTRSSC